MTRRWTATCGEGGPLCPARREPGTDLELRWNLCRMREDFAWRGLPPPDEGMVRERCLGKRVNASDLPTAKDFIRFHAAVSRGKIVELRTADFNNAFAEWFFAGFTRVTGTQRIHKNDTERTDWTFQVGQMIRAIQTMEGAIVKGSRPRPEIVNPQIIDAEIWE
jgi:hypothetical protein